MPVIKFENFDVNLFWEKTPALLRYVIIMGLIIISMYFLYTRKSNIDQIEEMSKISQSIETTYILINKFDKFKSTQLTYNREILTYLTNIYTLVEELNESTNRKFDMILESGGANTSEIIEKITILNESFEKLHKAYKPDDRDKPQLYIAPVDDDGNVILEDTVRLENKNK